MPADGIVAPDGRFWCVPLPDDRDRAVFYRPHGTTWLLNCFARDDREARKIIASIALAHGNAETAAELVRHTEDSIEIVCSGTVG
jgi:hypothetical protein